MFIKLLLAFTIIPVIELWLLIKISSTLGFLPALVLVFGTGVAGASLAKMEGLQTMQRIQTEINKGQMPKEELIDAFMLLVAGLLLITPGILTDLTGLSLLIPTFRTIIKKYLKKEVSKRVQIHHNGR